MNTLKKVIGNIKTNIIGAKRTEMLSLAECELFDKTNSSADRFCLISGDLEQVRKLFFVPAGKYLTWEDCDISTVIFRQCVRVETVLFNNEIFGENFFNKIHLDQPALLYQTSFKENFDNQKALRCFDWLFEAIFSGETPLKAVEEENLIKILFAIILLEALKTNDFLNVHLLFLQEKRLFDVWEYTEKNYQLEINNKILAKTVGLTESYFGMFLKTHTGFNPVDFTEIFRMKKALEMLSNLSNTVQEVAKATGYTDQAYFGRRFKKFFGVSPGAVRQNEQMIILKNYFGKKNS